MGATQFHAPWIAIGSRDGTTRQLVPQDLSVSSSSPSNNVINGTLSSSVNFSIASGTPTGSFIVEITNDPRAADQSTQTQAAWVQDSTTAVTSGQFAGSVTTFMVAISKVAQNIRVRYVATSGTGTGYAFFTGVNG